MTEPRRHRRPPAKLVFWSSALLFAALFALVTYSYEAESQTGKKAAQAVQVRKVIKRRVVTTVVGGNGGEAATATASPVTTSSEAAAPEPVVTSAS